MRCEYLNSINALTLIHSQVDISAVSGSSISLSKHNMESMFDSVEKKCGSKFGTIEIAADAGAKTSDIVGTIKMVIRPAKSGEKSSG